MLTQKVEVAVVRTTTPNSKNVSSINNTTRHAKQSSPKSTYSSERQAKIAERRA